MKKNVIANIPDIHCDGNEVEYVFHLLTAVLQSAGDQISLSELAVYSRYGKPVCLDSRELEPGLRMLREY